MNDKELREIQEDLLNKESSKLAKYKGVDLTNELEKMIKRNNDKNVQKKKKAIKLTLKATLILIIISIILILIICIWMYDTIIASRYRINVKEFIKSKYSLKVKCIYKDIGLNRNGLYIYELKENPNIKPHVIKNYGKIQEDVLERYYKYHFEKWEDEYKMNFKVIEGFQETTLFPEKTKEWLLSYKIYININNYQDLLNSTEAIIRFINFSENSLVGIYIPLILDGEKIYPCNKYPITNEEIRESAKEQYVSLVKRNHLYSDDIPKDIWSKYSNNS